MCRPSVVRATSDEPVSKEVTMDVWEWSAGTVCDAPSHWLIAVSVSTRRFHLSAGMNFFLIGCITLCSHVPDVLQHLRTSMAWLCRYDLTPTKQ